MRTNLEVPYGRGEHRPARTLGKTSVLRKLCGGRLNRWLTRWRESRGAESTPWPGWPVCRLILARYVRGELFIAIHGPRNDGHDYVAAVLESGAVAAVVAEPVVSRYPGWMQDRCITVPDTLEALHTLGTRRPQRLGQENLRDHRLRRAKPQRKRSWRHCWARSYGS